MREVLLLAGRHLREAWRSRGARVLALVFAAAVLLGILVPEGSGASYGTTLALLAALALLALLVAAASGTLLPADRGQGREEWLSALAPGGASRRLAAALSACGFLLLALPLAGGLAALAAGVAGHATALRSSAPLPIPAPARLPAPRGNEMTPLRLVLPEPARRGDLLEIDTRALVTSRDAAMDVTQHELSHVKVTWAVGGETGEVVVSRRAPLRVLLPEGGREVTLTNRSPTVHLRLEAARVLGGAVPFLPSLVLCALILALAAASLAPAAVAVSRVTSGPTATGVAIVLAVLGVLRTSLLDLEPKARPVLRAHRQAEAPLEPSAVERAAWEVLRVAVHVAPDLSGLDVLGEPAAGRALSVTALRGTVPCLAYGVVAILLAALPFPRRRST